MPGRLLFLLMGVSGSGKTTIGALLAGRLHCQYAEADAFHSPENVAKMAAGHPLTDEDRWPWLHAIGQYIDERIANGERAVVTCSGLKRKYRDLLRRPDVQIVYLRGSRELIAQRLAARHGHFFSAAMLDSQLADLEEPTPDEGVVIVPVSGTPAEIVQEIVVATGAEG